MLLALVNVPSISAQASVAAAATETPGVFEFSVTGFEDDETVSVWLTGPSQQVHALDTYDVDGSGNVTFQVRIPRHFEAGMWAITIASQDDPDIQAITTFNAPLRDPDVTLNVNQSSGAVGTTFTFGATDFQRNELVSYWLTAPSGQTFEGDLIQANDDGRVDFTYVIGAGSEMGQWMMSAYGLESDRLGVVSFTIR